MGRQMGLDIVYDMHPRHQNPHMDQVEVYRKFVGNWPGHLSRDLEKA